MNNIKRDNILNWLIIILGVLVIIILLSVPGQAYTTPDINIIIKIESGGNPKAYNPLHNDRGLMQITPIVLKDYNNLHHNKYTENDLFNPLINKIIGIWYIDKRIPSLLRHYHKRVTIDNILTAYNMGIYSVIRGRVDYGYINKYMKIKEGIQ